MGLPIKLQADEKVETIRKRHPVYVILKGILAVIIAGLVIWGLSWLSGQFSWMGSIGIWLIVGILLVVALYIAVLLYRYQNDLWIVTNQRLIDSLRKSPVNHELSSTDLINVQDISVRKRGIMATLFNFGDVLCQTASTDGEFSFVGVGDPAGLMEQLDRLRDEAREESRQAIGRAVSQATSQASADASAQASSQPSEETEPPQESS